MSRNLVDACLLMIIIVLLVVAGSFNSELQSYQFALSNTASPDVFFLAGIHTANFDYTVGNITIHYRVLSASDEKAEALIYYNGTNYLTIKTLHATTFGLDQNLLQFEQVGQTIQCFREGDTLTLNIAAGIHDLGLVEIWYDFNLACTTTTTTGQ